MNSEGIFNYFKGLEGSRLISHRNGHHNPERVCDTIKRTPIKLAALVNI